MSKAQNNMAAMAASLVFGLVPSVSNALGLGNLTLHSHLNQPLKAELELIATKGMNNSDIIAEFASQSDFDRAGLEKLFLLNKIDFNVESKNGKPVVVLTSDKPVKEPFLSFIVEVNWPNGKIMREYTLLLDPPKEAKRFTTTKTSLAKAALKPARSTFNNQHSVAVNDTLWEIAAQLVKFEKDLSVQQAMLAIFELNPNAFAKGNINRLRQGQLLDLPTKQQIANLSRQQAFAEVNQHNLALNNKKNNQVFNFDVATKSKPEFEQNTKTAKNKAKSSDKDIFNVAVTDFDRIKNLKFEAADVKPKNDAPLKLLEPTAFSDSSTDDRLAKVEETLNVMQKNNEALVLQQRTLEQQNAVLAQLIEMRNQEIEQLKSQLHKQAQLNTKKLANAIDKSLSKQDIETIPQERKVRPTYSASGIEAPTLAQPLNTQDKGGNGIIYFLSIAGMLIGGFTTFEFFRRRKQKEEEYTMTAPVSQTVSANTGAKTVVESFDLDSVLDAIDEAETSEKPAPKPEQKPKFVEKQPDKVDIADLLADADIYIAYERFEQAKSILISALNEFPSSIIAKIKLLEVYSLTDATDELNKLLNELPSDLESEQPDLFAKVQSLINKTTVSKPQDIPHVEETIELATPQEQENDAPLEMNVSPVKPEQPKQEAAKPDFEDDDPGLDFFTDSSKKSNSEDKTN